MKKQKDSEYRGYRTAGIRLKEELLPDIGTGSSRNEPEHLYACHMFDKAHLVMLAEENLIPLKDAALMLKSFREIEAEDVLAALLEVGGGIHSGEQYLIRKLSEEIGGRIHLGRSSGDLDKVAGKIRQRNKILAVLEAVNEFRDTLLKVADAHIDTVMPGYTHGQQAQPLTFGYQLLYWAVVLARDFKRLESAFHRTNISPAGAGILTGSNFPLNRQRTSDLLGFEKPCENAMDAVLSPDDFLETFSVITILHSNLARWADDIIFLAGSEIGMIELPDRFCSISSFLPQKKNPVTLEHIRGAAADTLGGLITAFQSESGPTGLSIYPRYHYAKPALDKSFDNVIRDIKWMGALVSDIRAQTEVMEEMAGAFWATANDVAGALVKEKDLPWRTAHQIVCILVRLSHERRIKPSDVTTELLNEAAIEYMGKAVGLSEESLQQALDPVESVRGRILYGGPAPEESQRRITEMRAMLEQDKKTVVKIIKRLEGASDDLEIAIDHIITKSERT